MSNKLVEKKSSRESNIDSSQNNLPSVELSTEAMMSYIVDYGSRVLVGNKAKCKNILDIVFYEEKECISSSKNGDSDSVLINLNKIKNKDHIKSIYNIIHKIVESLKVSA
jgi:hypothetical protein